MTLGLLDEAVAAGAGQDRVCKTLGLDPRTVQRWRKQDIGEDGRAGPKTSPGNKLTATERAEVIRLVNSPEYRDLSPKQIVPRLADLGIYVASESTIYRILREQGLVKHRESSRAPAKRHRPTEYVATGPNQVWSWDITYLKAPVRGTFFYLYAVIDVWSRKLVGWAVHDRECADLASEMIHAACAAEGIRRDQLVLHSDNGGPMKGATLLVTLQALGVVPSFSRPRVSDDNPYSESFFRTTKYRPEYPRGPFDSLEAARAWVAWFERWYNDEHLHSAIRFVTPASRHDGKDADILAARKTVWEAARCRMPERWSGQLRNWTPVEQVVLNPEPDQATSAVA